MIRFVAAVMLLAGGCSYAVMRRQHHPPECGSTIPVIVDGTGSIGMAVVGLLGVQQLAQEPTASKTVPALAAAGGIVAGVAFLVSSLHGQRLIKQCQEESTKPVETRRADTRDAAYSLTKKAQAAARAGDCKTVRDLAPQVEETDKDFYEVVFLRDAAIARCSVVK